MIVNLRQLIFEQLDKEAEKKAKSINNIIFENFTPIELEKQSMSYQHGRLIVSNNGKNLLFETKYGDKVEITLEHSLDELLVNDTISCQVLENASNIKTSDLISKYEGGGALTVNNGIDFQFSTPMYEGRFYLEERTGFNKTASLTRIS